MGVRLDRRTSWSAWFHHPPHVGPVMEWPGFLFWMIFLPSMSKAGLPVILLEDSGEIEGLGGRVVRP